ncbi:hypothetical protein B0H21DRAFT_286767 [Amylocystis lapponica]|nr:hypothetical protein B0H21DRAFT_286767 [Amylocystis lapponica]
MSFSIATSETPAQLWYEQSINAAVYIGAMAWGLHVAVFFKAVEAAFRMKSGLRWIPLAVALFALATINICRSISFNELAWIDDRSYPGGPLAFFAEQQSLPVNVAATATSATTFILFSAFLIYRCHALWRKLFLTIFFCVVLVASAVLSVLHCVQVARASSSVWDQSTLSLSVPYASLSTVLTTLLSIALAWRLIDLSRRLPPTLSSHAAEAYTSMEAMVIESALPAGLAALFFAVLYGTQNPGANLLVPFLVQLQGIVPELIVIRIIRGHAWAPDTASSVASKDGVRGKRLSGGVHVVSMVNLYDRDEHSLAAKIPTGLV